jgi:hypothetical protein
MSYRLLAAQDGGEANSHSELRDLIDITLIRTSNETASLVLLPHLRGFDVRFG